MKNNAHFLILTLLAVLFSSCAPLQLNVLDEKRDFNKYSKVFLVGFENDPKEVIPKLRSEFELNGVPAVILDKKSKYRMSQGTAFFVGADGTLITALHVMDTTDYATIWYKDNRYYADLVSSSTVLDLALLKLRPEKRPAIAPLEFASKPEVTMGEKVYTIGYPLTNMLGSHPRLSEGVVSANFGIKDDPNYVQVSAAIQPGNSGGPLLNAQGQVIGIIQQTINSERVIRESGEVPQNVNFALKGNKIVEFFESTATPHFRYISSSKRVTSIEKAQEVIVKIQPGDVPPDDEIEKILVVACRYYTGFNLSHQFAGFDLIFFDYKSGDPLFTVRQGIDPLGFGFNTVSSTIKATVMKSMEKIRGGIAPAVSETQDKSTNVNKTVPAKTYK